MITDLSLFPSGSAAKQAVRKQQLRTWKLQQQREQEDKRRQEEEERRKREDEIRRIRDLSNQDEQYNRFMKLVGGKTRMRSKVRGPSFMWIQVGCCRCVCCGGLRCPLFFSPQIENTGSLQANRAWTPRGTSTSTTTTTRLLWIRTARPDPQVRTHLCVHCLVLLKCDHCRHCPDFFHVSVRSPTHSQLPADEPGCLPQLSHFGMVRPPASLSSRKQNVLLQQCVNMLFLSVRTSSSRPSPRCCPLFLRRLRLSFLHQTSWSLLPNLPSQMRKRRRRCCSGRRV